MNEADRQAADLRSDPVVRVRRMIDEARANGDHEVADWHARALEDLKDSISVLDDLLTEQLHEVATALAQLGHGERRARAVRLVTVSRADVTADSESYPDGSALIRLSHPVVAIADLFCRHLGRVLDHGSRRANVWASFRRAWSGSIGIDGDLLAASLRYNMIHQRSLGLATSPLLLTTPAQGQFADIMLDAALRVFVAHEMAHHVLGHQSPSILRDDPGRRLAQENEADRLAFEAVLHSFRWVPRHLILGVVLGTLVALLVLASAEASLFVRRGRTHPPLAQRQDQLVEALPFYAVPSLYLYGRPMKAIVQEAADFTLGRRSRVRWDDLRDSEDILRTPLSLAFYDDVVRWDELQAMSTKELARKVAGHLPDERLRSAVTQAETGRAAEALHLWGVPDTHVIFLTQATAPLQFRTLRDAIAAVPGVRSLDRSTRELVADGMTALLDAELRKDFP